MWRSCCRSTSYTTSYIIGLKEFSVNASSILRTRAQIAKWTKAEADKVADEVMKCATQEEVYEILKRYQR